LISPAYPSSQVFLLPNLNSSSAAFAEQIALMEHLMRPLDHYPLPVEKKFEVQALHDCQSARRWKFRMDDAGARRCFKI
jgi:hypothetical protein